MTKVYFRGVEIKTEAAKSLPFREEVLISFDGGKTKKSLHKDAEALRKALDDGIIDFSYNPYSKAYLFFETIQAEDEVTPAVMDMIVTKALERKIQISVPEAMSLVNHPSVLKWLLEKGAKCRFVRGYGESTMENFLSKLEYNENFATECANLIKEYNAIDNDYLKKHGHEWSEKTVSFFEKK